jgi:hypothetical protein
VAAIARKGFNITLGLSLAEYVNQKGFPNEETDNKGLEAFI